MQRLKTKLIAALFAIAIGITLGGCEADTPSANPVNDMASAINEPDNDFQAFINPAYFGVVYKVTDTPSNRARIAILGADDKLFKQAKSKLLKSLEKGHTLAWLVKHNKPLILAIRAGEAEVHFTYSPEELRHSVFNK